MWPDDAIQRWVTAHRSSGLVDFAKVVTYAGDSLIVGPVAIIGGAVLAWRARRVRPLLASVAGWLAVEGAARLLKGVIGRPRPPAADAVVVLANSSMPSAHVARATFAVAVACLVVAPRWRQVAAVISAALVTLVAWSRLELGTHWLTDTLVAWPLALLAAWPLAHAERSLGAQPAVRAHPPKGRWRSRPRK